MGGIALVLGPELAVDGVFDGQRVEVPVAAQQVQGLIVAAVVRLLVLILVRCPFPGKAISELFSGSDPDRPEYIERNASPTRSQACVIRTDAG